MELPPIKLPEAKDYPEAYRRIVNAMKSADVLELGQRKPRLTKAGEDRAASLDLDPLNRVARTVTVCHIALEQLNRWHKIEQDRGEFCVNFEWLRKKLDFTHEPIQLTEARIKNVQDFQDDQRPDLRKFRDVSIPPYFSLDNDFDGMEWHQKCDLAYWKAKGSLYLPSTGGRVTGKKVLADMAMLLVIFGYWS